MERFVDPLINVPGTYPAAMLPELKKELKKRLAACPYIIRVFHRGNFSGNVLINDRRGNNPNWGMNIAIKDHRKADLRRFLDDIYAGRPAVFSSLTTDTYLQVGYEDPPVTVEIWSYDNGDWISYIVLCQELLDALEQVYESLRG